MTDFLREYGSRLLDRGYDIVPIAPGYKYPKGLDEWQTLEADAVDLKGWLSNGFAKGGVGILTKNTPAIDLDIRDKEIVDQLIDWCSNRLGYAPQRTGQAPKTLLVYYTDAPFPKIMSKTYVDMFGQEHRIEVLGDGQQFVAYAQHPDTGQPYEWNSVHDLTELDRGTLPLIHPEDALDLIAYFETIIPDDWEPKTEANASKPVDPSLTPEERALINSKPKIDISDENVRKCLAQIDADDYHEWVKVGMALYHQYDGTPEGFELWDTWSQDSAKYDAAACERRWNSFKADITRQEPVTFATIIKQAREIYAKTRFKEKSKGMRLLSTNDMWDELGPVDWLIEDYLETDAVNVFYGAGGTYKTFAALDAALSIATGRPWQDKEVKQGLAVYIPGEGKAGLIRRARAWFKHFGVDADTDNFKMTDRGVPMTDAESVENLISLVENTCGGRSPSIVVIDTLAKNFGASDENSTKDMNAFVNNVEWMIRDRFNCAVVIVHHVSKANPKAMRGSAALNYGVEAAFLFEKKEIAGDKWGSIENVRMKNAAEIEGQIWFKATPVEWSERGCDYSEFVMVRGEPEFEVAQIPPLKGKQKALYELIEHEGEITRDKLREVAIAEGICETADSVKRALNELKGKNVITEIEGVISINFDF